MRVISDSSPLEDIEELLADLCLNPHLPKAIADYICINIDSFPPDLRNRIKLEILASEDSNNA